MPSDLPHELLREIFDIAIGPDAIERVSLIGCMEESSWSDMLIGGWMLVEPRESLLLKQRRSYALKKVRYTHSQSASLKSYRAPSQTIMLTCKAWSRVGVEFMYRSFLLCDPHRLRKLCEILDGNSKIGRWTRSICIYKDTRRGTGDITFSNMGDSLVSIVRHCSHLRVFIIDPPIGNRVFPPLADSLRTYCPLLMSVQWQPPYDSQGKVMPALRTLRSLVSLEIVLLCPLPDRESDGTLTGLRGSDDISFPHLRELSLRGSIQDFLEQLPSWHLPSLSHLTLDFGLSRFDFPDIVEVLGTHGHQLKCLDVNSVPPLDVPHMLSTCPNLDTFCFNLDWQLDGFLNEVPHQHIRNIGLHGLKHAFGVGYAGVVAGVNPFDAVILRRRNDNNFAALVKVNFPLLAVVRVLDPMLLRALNKEDGPAPGVCYDRWERWWEQCARQRVRLEDCTGNDLGNLPEREDDELEEEGW